MSENPNRSRDRGQATPLWAVVLVLAGLLLVPVALVAKATIERSKAQSAADAAALAGALDGEEEARAVAAANGARVREYRQLGPVVEVVVVVGNRRATARAIREEVPVSPRPRGRPR
jgi:uncharacterized membrane protein